MSADRRRPARAGISMVEVLLATVVVGAGLAVVAGTISTSTRMGVRADGLTRAARLLEIQLGRVEGGALPLAPATGSFEEDGEPEVSWTIAVDATDVPDLQQVTITAEWFESGDPRDLDLVRLIYVDPEASNGSSALGTASTLGGGTSSASGGASSSGGGR